MFDICLATRQELDDMGARDMIGGEEVVIPMKGESEREKEREIAIEGRERERVTGEKKKVRARELMK